MTKFRFNISKVNEHCQSIENSLKKYNELSDRIYANVKSSNNVWIDPASLGFNQIVCQDESVLKDIKISLKKYHNNLVNFSSELGNIFKSRGYNLTDMSIYYDSSYVDICIDKLNSASSLLQNALKDFGNCVVPEDFEYLSSINDVYNNTFNLNNRILELSEDISSIRKGIDILMYDTIKRNSDIELITCNDKVTRFNWEIFPLARKNKPILVKKNEYKININNLDSKSHEAILNNASNPIKVSSSTIETLSEQTSIQNSETTTITNNNQDISTGQLNDYTTATKYNVKSQVNKNNTDNKDLIENDNLSLNFDKNQSNTDNLNLLEDEKHNLESDIVKTDIETINLDNEEDAKLGISSIDTTVNEN